MKAFAACIQAIRPVSPEYLDVARKHMDNLTKPLGSLGRLEELACRIVAIRKNTRLPLKNKCIFTIAADHGVAVEGISAYPAEVTPQMVHNFLNGGAAINALARQAGARVVVVDMGVNADLSGAKEGLQHRKIASGTQNMTLGPAMSRQQAEASIQTGIALVEEQLTDGLDIIGTGEMGIGNTTASSAITAVLLGLQPAQVTGRGTGVDDGMLANKVRVIENAIAMNKPDPKDPLDVLAKVGGFEIGGLVGVILAASRHRIPVLVDGFISGAAALLAARLAPASVEYMVASHCSAEQGHRAILRALGLEPLLDLGLRLGEGTGAALAMPIVDAALRVYAEMATFDSAGVSSKEIAEQTTSGQ